MVSVKINISKCTKLLNFQDVKTLNPQHNQLRIAPNFLGMTFLIVFSFEIKYSTLSPASAETKKFYQIL